MIPITITVMLDVTDRLALLLRELAMGGRIVPPPERSGGASHGHRRVVKGAPKRARRARSGQGRGARFLSRPWTAERLALLKRLDDGTNTPTSMLPRIAALPGEPLTLRAVSNKLFVTRKQRRSDAPAPIAVPSPPIVVRTEPSPSQDGTSVLAVRRTDIEAWCRQAEVPFRSLDFVNRQRSKRALPPFHELDT